MKKTFLLTSASLIILAACNSNSDKTTTNTDSTIAVNADSVTKTTTTTVSKTTYSKRRLETAKLVDIKTKQAIVLVYDTVHYYYVDSKTMQQPKSYYFDEATKDTFDYRGYLVNNSLIMKDGDYMVDETKLFENPYNVEVRSNITAAPNPAEVDKKIKTNGNSYKEKTDTSKIKITDNKTKIKIKNPS